MRLTDQHYEQRTRAQLDAARSVLAENNNNNAGSEWRGLSNYGIYVKFADEIPVVQRDYKAPAAQNNYGIIHKREYDWNPSPMGRIGLICYPLGRCNATTREDIYFCENYRD